MIMSHYKNWQIAKKNKAEAVDWLANKDRIDSQDRKKYILIIHLSVDSIQYCGQSYAGANNYHAMPNEFASAMEEAFKRKSAELFDLAISIMDKKEIDLAVAAESEVSAMMAEINTIKGGK